MKQEAFTQLIKNEISNGNTNFSINNNNHYNPTIKYNNGNVEFQIKFNYGGYRLVNISSVTFEWANCLNNPNVNIYKALNMAKLNLRRHRVSIKKIEDNGLSALIEKCEDLAVKIDNACIEYVKYSQQLNAAKNTKKIEYTKVKEALKQKHPMSTVSKDWGYDSKSGHTVVVKTQEGKTITYTIIVKDGNMMVKSVDYGYHSYPSLNEVY